MKITTWNVNGLRALMNKGAWDWVDKYKPDVLCLQEIKARSDQLSEKQRTLFNGYNACWNPAERPGYSGVLTLYKSESFINKLGIGIEKFDVEGRVIQTIIKDFRLFNIYFPNGGRDLSRVPYKLEFYQRLLDYLDRLHGEGENVILTGDFNTAHKEIDIKNARANKGHTGFLPEERDWISKYLEHGLVDVYRFLYPEEVKYTWWSFMGNARANNTGWRLDYFLVSEGLIDRVKDVTIHEKVMGSDHCPVSLII